jgi:GT2 family glycosyltransferase
MTIYTRGGLFAAHDHSIVYAVSLIARAMAGVASAEGGHATAPLGVILVNFHSFDDVDARVRSPALKHARVAVVDNASDPRAVAALCAETGAIPVLIPANAGFAVGVAAGVDALGKVEELLLLNPDAELGVAELASLRTALRERRLDGVAPLLREPSGRLQVGAAGGPVSVWSFAVYFLGLSHLVPWLRGVFLTRRQLRKASRVHWLCAACLLLHGDAFARFGGMPTDELVYGEDVAWGTSATAAGARLAILPSVVVPHRVGGSGASHLWSGALERLARRRLGRRRGWLAVIILRFGLRLRQLLGRSTGSRAPLHGIDVC